EPAFITGNVGPIRLVGDPSRLAGYIYNDSGTFDDAFAPSLHRVFCSTASNPTWQLSLLAPPAVPGPLFPDLRNAAVRSRDPISTADEQILISWEGPLAGQAQDSRKTGGRFEVGDQTMTLHASGALLCSLGPENGDIVNLLGCISDGDCDLGESCIVHPDAPPGSTGMCLPTLKAGALSGDCREIMITQRRFTATEVGDDHMVLVP